MIFRLTDAGRAAIVDSANRRTRQVVFSHMAIGDGVGVSGVDDGGRVALRNERLREGLAAVEGGSARLGMRASFTGAPGSGVWSATEVGLIAQVGAEPAFLAAYGAVEAAGDAYAVIAPGISAVVAATVDVVVSDADVAVMVAPDLTVAGASTFAALLDTPAALTPRAYYRANAGGAALTAALPAAVLSDLLTGIDAGSFLRVTGPPLGLEGLTAAELAALLAPTFRSRVRTLTISDNSSTPGFATSADEIPAGSRVVGVVSLSYGSDTIGRGTLSGATGTIGVFTGSRSAVGGRYSGGGFVSRTVTAGPLTLQASRIFVGNPAVHVAATARVVVTPW